MIKFFGLDRQYQSLKEEILDATDQVLKTGLVLDGPFTKKFETAIALRTHRTYAIAVNSCTQALIFAQQCTNNQRKTLIPSISFIATLNSVLMTGNTPVFCNTDDQGLIDLESLDMNLNDAGIDTVMYVNLFGNVVDYDRFTTQTQFFNKDIFVIEDAAQSFGASYKGIPSGKLGTISCLSFDPTKNLPNYGSGGMLLTDDYQIYDKLRNLRDNGKYSQHELLGTNSKMSETDCASMLVKLKYFDSWQRRREDIAEYYTRELNNLVETPSVEHNVNHAWHKYVIKFFARNSLKEHLEKNNIETKIHYSQPLFDSNLGFSYVNSVKQLYRESSKFCMECLSLPIYPELTDAEVEKIVSVIENFNT
jgi:dTDP-4-amino-4,6-dideoxygalactose transaminase